MPFCIDELFKISNIKNILWKIYYWKIYYFESINKNKKNPYRLFLGLIKSLKKSLMITTFLTVFKYYRHQIRIKHFFDQFM